MTPARNFDVRSNTGSSTAPGLALADLAYRRRLVQVGQVTDLPRLKLGDIGPADTPALDPTVEPMPIPSGARAIG